MEMEWMYPGGDDDGSDVSIYVYNWLARLGRQDDGGFLRSTYTSYTIFVYTNA